MKKKLLIVITDVLSVCIAYGLALLLRFDMRYSAVPSEYIRGYLFYIILASVILVSSYTIAKLYRSVWTYAGIPEVLRTFVTSGIAAAITGVTYTISVIRMPISFYLVGWGLVFALTASSRMMYRLLRRARIKAEGVKANPVRQNIMIIGAGAAGLMLLKEYRTSYYLTDKVKIFIDDNEEKWNKYLDGVRIAGGRDQILASVDKYNIDKIILALPTAGRKDVKAILEICNQTDCQIKTVPGVYQLVNGEVNVSKLRNVEIEDLLGREPIKVNLDEILGYIKGKTVLVTGGGGSIGSEICTQLAEHRVGHLVIFDIYENNAYEIQQKLKWEHPELKLADIYKIFFDAIQKKLEAMVCEIDSLVDKNPDFIATEGKFKGCIFYQTDTDSNRVDVFDPSGNIMADFSIFQNEAIRNYEKTRLGIQGAVEHN